MELAFLLKIIGLSGSILVGITAPFIWWIVKERTPIEKVIPKEDDNALEEMVEDVIEKTTGIDVDLTPESPEDGKKKVKKRPMRKSPQRKK